MVQNIISWLGETTNPGESEQYALKNTISVTPNRPILVCIVEAIIETAELQDGQTSLSLYDHIDTDALNEIISTSKSKKSDIEVRFTFNDLLIIVRSDNTISIYELLNL